MKNDLLFLCMLAPLVIFGASGCAVKATDHSEPHLAHAIWFNQEGYVPLFEKKAFTTIAANHFEIKNMSGTTVWQGKPGPRRYWAESGDSLMVLDFTQFADSGHYVVVVNDSVVSYPVRISSMAYKGIATSSIKALYFNRASEAIPAEFGGIWQRAAGHPDTVVLVHASAADRLRPEGTVISSPGGWYDAGDYNKYIVNSGISTYTLLLALQQYPEWFKTQKINIPESLNELPDLLDEILYNLRWMLTMQDPNDGGVYHKLTTLNFEGFVMPDACDQPRYVVQKSTTATLDFAATMAFAHRTLKPFENLLPGFADQCIAAAQKAYAWALENPKLQYLQPDDVTTGAYGDSMMNDEWFWASTELYLSVGNGYAADLNKWKPQSFEVPSWDNVASLGLLSLVQADARPDGWSPTEVFMATASALTDSAAAHPALISPNAWAWGSNSQVANQGMFKLMAYRITGERRYLNSALNDLHYLLGRNATGYCFVTGAGTHSSQFIHHRPSGADGKQPPVPGFLAGGPNLTVMTDCGDSVVRSAFPAKSYVDLECSYSTNEVAINWNAPLVFLTNGVCYEMK